MGIQGLCQFLRKIAPDLVVEVPITSLSGQRLAVDASVYLYKFVCMDNQLRGNWLDMFISFILWLRKNNIRPVFVFDGKPPPQKQRTQEERRETRHRTEQKVKELEEILDLLQEYDLDENIPKDLEQRIVESLGHDLLGYSRKEVLREIMTIFKKENGKTIHITPKENKGVQKLLDCVGLPWFKATGEAEKSCAWLCTKGYVKGVISTDSDVLAYGTPIFIQNIRVNEENCSIIRYQDVLEVLDLTELQFKDLCIMCGTDYNKRMRGIGPHKAYALLCDHQDLDEISQTNVDTDILFYQEGRRLFTLPDTADEVLEGVSGELKIPAMQAVQKGRLQALLLKCNSRFTVEEIEMYSFKPKFRVE